MSAKSFILNLEELPAAACVIPGKITFEEEPGDEATRYAHLDLDPSYISAFVAEKFPEIEGTVVVSVALDDDDNVVISFVVTGGGGID